MWEDLTLEEYVMGEDKFNEKGAGFSCMSWGKRNSMKRTRDFLALI